MKKIILSIFVLLLSIFFVACSSNDTNKTSSNENSDDTSNTETSSNKMTIVEGKISVGSVLTSPPNTYIDESTQEEKGLYVDIVYEIADRLGGYEVEFVATEWASLIPALKSNKVDIIAEAMYVTEERQKEINFTDYISSFGEGLVVHEDENSVSTLEDLKDKKIGVQIGTTYAEMLEELNISDQLVTYESIREMLIDLTHKRLDGVLADEPILIYLAEKDPQYNIKVVNSYESRLPGNIGIGVNKENEELLNELNKIIAEMKEDGTLKEIHDKHNLPYYLD